MVENIASSARLASLELATISTDKKNKILIDLSEALIERQKDIIAQNKIDLENGKNAGLSFAMLERLALDDKKIKAMAQGVEQIASLEDPVGEILSEKTRPNGIVIKKVRVPIGVIAIIYESRPNVTVDCAALCLKSGNATILRGGKEAFYSNKILVDIIKEVLNKNMVNTSIVEFIPTPDRKELEKLIKLSDYIDCIIPRGGESLIRFVTNNSNIPVIKHYKGVCNVYISKNADLKMAKEIAINSKCNRPAACNAAENLIFDKDLDNSFVEEVCSSLAEKNVDIVCDKASFEILTNANIACKLASEEDFFEEYLDYKISVKILSGVKEAIDFINLHSSKHSDCIVSSCQNEAEQFLNEIDSSCVYHNASTRFTDGFEFGLGAEIGISTDKLHARGPMGLAELCTYKYKIYGNGQIR